MKTHLLIVRVSFWGILGITILLTSLAPGPASPGMAQKATPTPQSQMGTIVAETSAQEEAGSTDGIMIAAVVIVLIVILPILLYRQAWENGNRHKTAPPR